ncbi:MAG TPA: hypothetical protein VJ785_19375 [Anaerolineales bacterium]|nr:hypothetical protein [Anaerolineales bacterium]
MKPERENDGKLLLIGASVLIWLLILLLLRNLGYHATWGLWKVPSWLPPFLDFRLIPGSAESFANGFEPSVENPYDPTERIFNYPAFWRLFFYTGITQADTVWISVSMIILFFIGAFLFPEKLSIPGAIGMLVVLFSPASMLLYERGNVDLFVFFICALAVFAASFSAYLASALILFASIMKLFPILGLSILLKETKKKFLWLSITSVLVLLMYMILTWESVRAAWDTTMRGDGLSYGTNILITRYEAALTKILTQWLTPHRTDLMLKYGLLAVALVILFLVVILAFANTYQSRTETGRNFDAFRMGAAIYVGTFLLGNNFDYRLAFLVLVMPQLVEWTRSTDRLYRGLAWLNIFLVLTSCWHLWIIQIPLESIFHSAADSQKFWIILDEILNWMLFTGLAYLLFASMPQWIKELPGMIRSKIGFRPKRSHEQSSPTIS